MPKNLEELNREVERLAQEKEEAVLAGDFEAAAKIKGEQDTAEKKFMELQNRLKKKKSVVRQSVEEKDIAAVVSAWTKIPVQRLEEKEAQRLLRLEQTLHKRVVGQDEAVSAVAKAIKRGRVGLKDPRRPIGSFLFLGPTGVGKTELSKALAEVVFGSEQAM